jgi:hypothetical protein
VLENQMSRKCVYKLRRGLPEVVVAANTAKPACRLGCVGHLQLVADTIAAEPV